MSYHKLLGGCICICVYMYVDNSQCHDKSQVNFAIFSEFEVNIKSYVKDVKARGITELHNVFPRCHQKTTKTSDGVPDTISSSSRCGLT